MENTMNDYTNEKLFTPKLSRVRTFLFGALAFVWLSEMIFLGFPSLAKVHSHMWQVPIPENPQLETALYIAWALSAPVKGALFVMAIIGLMSKNPATRAVLFASMSLIPLLNIAFPFRQQGFLFGPVAVATAFSIILWGSFFFIRERIQQPEQSRTGGSAQLPPSRWEIFQYVWFAGSSAFLTLTAFLFLFETRTTLNFIFPCLSALMNANEGGLSSPIHSTMAAGTHVLALSIASWIATVRCRSNRTLRNAMTIASIVFAVLIFVFPLRQLMTSFEENGTTPSALIPFTLLLAGWFIYAALSQKWNLKNDKNKI